MNLMTTRQRDDEDLTDYTKHFKVVRDLSKEKYGGILSPHGSQIKNAATSQCMPVSYPSCISRIWIKQNMAHSSRRWQKTSPQAGQMSTQSILRMCNISCPIHKYDQAYHNKWEKQQDNCDKGHTSSKNKDHSTTWNVPNIVEMSFTQMER